jgi:uncharacterized membrane protein YhiD involved in acid resistance
MTRVLLLTFSLFLLGVEAGAQPELPQPPPSTERVDLPGVMDNLQEEVQASLVRLPLAALLGTVLALRPRRGAQAPRQPTVVQTQIILAVVGALIMLIVGSSLARAFGIVGAANLIRYRSKIDDPKDAVVMLCALSVGLASGVGLYGLAAIGTVFILISLWILEGFEPQTRVFELSLKLGDTTQDLKPKIEQILRRYKVRYEMRVSSAEELGYQVTTPRKLATDKVSTEIMELVPEGKGAIVWDEKSKDKVPK